jgi:hypothetical protein
MISAKGDYGGEIDFKKINKAIRSDAILLGYPEGMQHNSGKITLDKIALFNSEPEIATMPARPFLQQGIKANIKEINKEIKLQYLGMIKGKTPNLDKIGVTALKGIQEFVRGDYYRQNKPNKPATIRRKTSKKGRKTGELKDKPLIDTGQLINGLTYTTEKL